MYTLRSRGHLETVYETQEEKFVYILPHDTVSILTYEYVKVNSKTTGNIVSRVRNVSNGLGNISTTTDPGWNGMLLISMQNVSDRKVKFQLERKVGGKAKRQGVATILFYAEEVMSSKEAPENKGDSINISLDYPAMRTDILSEFTAEPHRLKHSKEYQKLRKLVNELSALGEKIPKEGENLKKLKEILIALKNSKSKKEQETLLDILKYDKFTNSHELKEKISKIIKARGKKGAEKETYLKKEIECALKECDYEGVCEYVEEIHNLISQYVNYRWPHEIKKSFWLKCLASIKQNWVMILGYSIIFIAFYIFVVHQGYGMDGTIPPLLWMLTTIIPPLLNKIRKDSR